MRKAIPTSLVLLAISLIGFVILQINWVFNIVQTQQHKIVFNLNRAGTEIADSLGGSSSAVSVRLRNQGFPASPFVFSDPFDRINQRLSRVEINNIVRKILKNNDLDQYEIDYAIFYGNLNGLVEFATPNYAQIMHRLDTDSLYFARSLPQLNFPVNPQIDNGSFSAHEYFSLVFPDIRSGAWRSLTWILIGSAVLTLITISAFYLTVRTMLEQRKLSKIKSDFINNMTHEFKTPLATISLAVDALHNTRVQGDKEKTKYFSGIIKEENKRMNKHVETILQAAFMEKQELSLNRNEIHIHDIINKLVENFYLQLADKSGEAVTHLNATNDLISGDEVHITNLINNLIDNAVKYSKPEVPPRIVITTTNSAKNLIIQIKDNGIGMSKESVKRIFEKFYRAHTGNIHNVKGFGLGMSYVKDIIVAHKGKIKVDSTLGKGSVFIVELPLI